MAITVIDQFEIIQIDIGDDRIAFEMAREREKSGEVFKNRAAIR